ncbi:mitochondrial 37S ribosomal protein mS29 [Kwoniella pini CBS 10737]|uniref:Small ribosomal subunit protein mS29 n=1 Tax=Kwoniella pini CBS 10737 TaxID=1296096 RepID=A0A1B9IBM4_9TREE|nr:uncharacterized protein I206_00117 [Kwoniella pini CBS 10737]OCF52821.1 hypothetical protein I206_00117 [Kwoniella pini CBS 10737]
MRPIIRFSSTPLSRGISTSSTVLAAAKPKKATASSKNAKQGFNQKKKETTTGGSSGSGQSNVALKFSMAGQVPDLSDYPKLQPINFKSENVGRPTTFPKTTFDKLKLFGLSKKVEQELSANGGPASVIRQSTIDLAKQLDGSKAKSSKDARYVLTGERGSGKSMLLLQTVAYALESGWIVLFNPKATEWTNSSSHYIYDSQTQLFSQWQSAQSILSTLLAINKDKLDAIKLTSDIELAQGKTASKGSKLSDLVATGSKDDRVAVKVLDEVMAVLEKQTQFPVIWAIDEAQTLFTTSQYRTQEYTPIEPYHLSTPRLALDFVSGRRSFAKGTVLTSLSLSDPKNPLSPSLIDGLKLPTTQPITPYTRLDPYHSLHASSGLKKIEIPFNMSDEEISGLYKLLVRKGKTSNNQSDNLYMEIKSLSGGNPNEIKRGLSRLTAAITV